MDLKNMAKSVGRFVGLAMLAEAALMLVVGGIAFAIGVRTWGVYGTWLFYGGLVTLVGGLISTVTDPVKAGTQTGYFPRTPANLSVSTEEVWPDRRPVSRNFSASLVAGLVGIVAIAIGLMLSGV